MLSIFREQIFHKKILSLLFTHTSSTDKWGVVMRGRLSRGGGASGRRARRHHVRLRWRRAAGPLRRNMELTGLFTVQRLHHGRVWIDLLFLETYRSAGTAKKVTVWKYYLFRSRNCYSINRLYIVLFFCKEIMASFQFHLVFHIFLCFLTCN